MTHTIGNRATKVAASELAKLIDATRQLHDPDEDSDFLDATNIVIELNGLVEVLIELMEEDARPLCARLSQQPARAAFEPRRRPGAAER